jgi:hypothetical protein
MWSDLQHSRWTVPALSVLMGLVLLGAAAYGGQPVLGLGLLAVMTLYGLVVLTGGKREAIRGVRGGGRDERPALIDLRATAYSGLVVTAAIIGGFIYELAQGRDGRPYTWLAILSGAAYAAFGLLRRRRD